MDLTVTSPARLRARRPRPARGLQRGRLGRLHPALARPDGRAAESHCAPVHPAGGPEAAGLRGGCHASPVLPRPSRAGPDSGGGRAAPDAGAAGPPRFAESLRFGASARGTQGRAPLRLEPEHGGVIGGVRLKPQGPAAAAAVLGLGPECRRIFKFRLGYRAGLCPGGPLPGRGWRLKPQGPAAARWRRPWRWAKGWRGRHRALRAQVRGRAAMTAA